MKANKLEEALPILPLRDVVVYPHMVIPLFVGRAKSIQALTAAMSLNKQILLLAQKKPGVDDPAAADMYRFGTVASILQLLKLPDGTVKVLVEGGVRAKLKTIADVSGYFVGQIEYFKEAKLNEAKLTPIRIALIALFERYIKLNKKIPQEIFNSLSSIGDSTRVADTIIAHMNLKISDKQFVLELPTTRERMEKIIALIEGEIDLLKVEQRIRGRVKRQMEKSQREYYLNEQIKAIQKELGELEEAPNELEALAAKIEDSGMPKEAHSKAKSELNKLKMMPPMSAESSVVRNYVEWMVNVPWKKKSKVRHDISQAEAILEEDHYGLEKVKERILEYLAVQQRVRKLKGPVLCLVGPPGVGKTSLGQSIARATHRQFVRMSLGGVRDEAEIRGHRRTYIGSMPGKIIQKLAKSKVKNPLFLLDEIDKMSMDMRGDPASALLEVLDPEQNHTFNDHYLEVDYDLSEIMFVATANTLNIPPPLLDRMEVIRLAGYTEHEKINIASHYLIPKQIKNNGLKKNELTFGDGSVRDIIRYYSREAGVRSLEREISKICRKVVKELLVSSTELAAKDKRKAQVKQATQGKKAKRNAKKAVQIVIEKDNLNKYLGVRRYKFGRAGEQDQIGHTTGLAWTEVGGELLDIEVAGVPGKGKHSFTGQLGEVMQESIQAAMTVVRSRAMVLGINQDFHEKLDIHIHVPEGATPKDGPSAGIGMCTAIVSMLTGIPVRADVAMTGEITLRGEILPIGGLKEKLLAAHRGGITKVVIPADNEKDLEEIPENIKQDLTIYPIKWVDKVLEVALQTVPVPLAEYSKELPNNPKKMADIERVSDQLSTH